MLSLMKQPIPSVLPRGVIHLFFWIGLIAAVCIRSITIVSRVDADAAIWVWRFAMLCYLFFFGYRYWIGQKRRRVIVENCLIDRFESWTDLDAELREPTLYILRSITRSKELFNYATIFLLSLLALLIDLLIS